MADRLTSDFEGDRSIFRCGVCGSAGPPLWQMSCAKPACTQKHQDDDGEVVDCNESGPLLIHFNVTRCRACGGGEAIENAMRMHRMVCSATRPPAPAVD